MRKKAYHGGAFFKAVGEDFSTLERSKSVINADVLDAWFDPSPKAVKRIKRFLAYSLKTSPPIHGEGLIKTISEHRKIPLKNILVSGGSSDLMFAFFPRFLDQNSKVMILDPMYGEYAHIFKNVIGLNLIRFKLHKKNFVVNVEKLIAEIKAQKPDMIVMVNPNSPTGQYLPKNKFIEIMESVPKTTFVIVDETYIDYVNPKYSLELEVKNYKNLVIIKSMSKVYALSGTRVGYLVANAKIIDKVATFIPPWPVSTIGQIAGVEALRDVSYYRKKYKETHKLREKLTKDLNKIPNIKVYNSVANFILVELLDKSAKADVLVNKLRKQNIFIRDCSSMSSQFRNNFIRITVENSSVNKKIAAAIKAAL